MKRKRARKRRKKSRKRNTWKMIDSMVSRRPKIGRLPTILNVARLTMMLKASKLATRDSAWVSSMRRMKNTTVLWKRRCRKSTLKDPWHSRRKEKRRPIIQIMTHKEPHTVIARREGIRMSSWMTRGLSSLETSSRLQASVTDMATVAVLVRGLSLPTVE